MKILLIHNTLNSMGGEGKVALHFLKILIEEGFDVSLLTVEKTDWDKIARISGVELPKIPKEFWLMRELQRFGLYQRQLLAFSVMKLRKRYDIIINTHGDVMPVHADVTYMHFPLAVFLEGPWSAHTKYQKSLFWKIYFSPYYLAQKASLKTGVFEKTLVITNSRFSREVIRNYLGKNALVIHPPVEIYAYDRIAENVNRKNAVTTVSRFVPEKNLHVLPYLARSMPDVEFNVVGSVGSISSFKYFSYITKLKERLGVRNLKLFPNAPHHVKLKKLGESKVLLHLMPYEHFGIAVVEGQASGCIPVVHKSGGQWTDIVEEGKYGVGYSSISIREIKESVEKALEMWSPQERLRMSTHANRFSEGAFKDKIRALVKKMIHLVD